MADDPSTPSTLNYDFLSHEKYLAAIGVGLISASLSLYGSLAAMYVILRHRKWGEAYHRLILGLVTSDLLLSVSIIAQTWALPSHLGLPGAVGNTASCDAVGWLFQYYIASSVYNAELSLYFYFRIKYNQNDRTWSRMWEPWVHVVPFAVPTMFGVLGTALGLFHPSFTFKLCDFWVYPADCVLRADVPCQRATTRSVVSVGYTVSTEPSSNNYASWKRTVSMFRCTPIDINNAIGPSWYRPVCTRPPF